MSSTPSTSSSAVEQSMETLNAQWYNAVTSGLSLDPTSFQLFQGNKPLDTASELSVWNVFDSIPPPTINQYFNPNQFNSFSQNYKGVIFQLIPQGTDQFNKAMGDYLSNWMSYLKTNPTLPSGSTITQQYEKLFQTWAYANLPPGMRAQAIAAYNSTAENVVTTAQGMWLNMQNAATNPNVAAYSNTIENLTQNMPSSIVNKTVTLDSSTQSSDISHSWAKASVGGGWDFFWGRGGGKYDSWTSQIANAGLKISANFKYLQTFAAGPLRQPSSDLILQNYTPWYDSDAMGIAYNNNDNTVWQHGLPSWESTFGLTGNMQYVCSALVVVDGITVTTSSDAGISKSDQSSFQSSAEGGFFPFFIASASGGWSNSYNFDDQGNFSISSTSPAGNPTVLGVIVTPVSSFVAGS